MYSAFKPISDENHNNVGLKLNLSNTLGLSLINVFLAGKTPFSPNRPRKRIDYILYYTLHLN